MLEVTINNENDNLPHLEIIVNRNSPKEIAQIQVLDKIISAALKTKSTTHLANKKKIYRFPIDEDKLNLAMDLANDITQALQSENNLEQMSGLITYLQKEYKVKFPMGKDNIIDLSVFGPVQDFSSAKHTATKHEDLQEEKQYDSISNLSITPDIKADGYGLNGSLKFECKVDGQLKPIPKNLLPDRISRVKYNFSADKNFITSIELQFIKGELDYIKSARNDFELLNKITELDKFNRIFSTLVKANVISERKNALEYHFDKGIYKKLAQSVPYNFMSERDTLPNSNRPAFVTATKFDKKQATNSKSIQRPSKNESPKDANTSPSYLFMDPKHTGPDFWLSEHKNDQNKNSPKKTT